MQYEHVLIHNRKKKYKMNDKKEAREDCLKPQNYSIGYDTEFRSIQFAIFICNHKPTAKFVSTYLFKTCYIKIIDWKPCNLV